MGGLLHLVQRGAEAGCSPTQSLLAVPKGPNVTAHPWTASVPTSYYSMWHYYTYSYLCTLEGYLVDTAVVEMTTPVFTERLFGLTNKFLDIFVFLLKFT